MRSGEVEKGGKGEGGLKGVMAGGSPESVTSESERIEWATGGGRRHRIAGYKRISENDGQNYKSCHFVAFDDAKRETPVSEKVRDHGVAFGCGKTKSNRQRPPLSACFRSLRGIRATYIRDEA
ncbi:hypothetical protein GWI33_010781 [Rhynchophorus ferrugineus]|uniref:Uncharacterized protein n=1 Tax=Rhynchophorus ferrugineus TaxID=354439 RepID=A0A834IUN1_RHYFE|nr:hypothetical protein GWI33_010781 [Rhynchophorus ferrugineus]